MPSDIQQFERTFADLAYAALKSRAPMLMNYLQGWQLVDSSDDETKAVGIFGFKIGKQWVYKPVFFMNGELKGNELLYLKDQDIFVPMQENWLNYIINRQPFILGETEPQTLEEMGYMQPDLTQYAVSPTVAAKRASDDSDRIELAKKVNKGHPWAKAAVELLWGVDIGAKPYKEAAARLHLPAFFKVAGLQAYEIFLSKLAADENFANAAFSIYKPEDFEGLVEEAADVFKQGALDNQVADRNRITKDEGGEDSTYKDEHRIRDTAPDVVVIMPGSGQLDGVLGGVDDEEKERLLRGEIVVRDHRDDTSQVIPADIHKQLFNPTESGVYDILVRDGEFRKMVVSVAPYEPNGYGSGDSDGKLITLFDPETKTYGQAVGASVFAKKRYYDDSWQKIWDGLSDARNLTRDNVYMAIGPNGNTVSPFRVWETDKDPSGRTYVRYSRECFRLDDPKSYLGMAPFRKDWKAREAMPGNGSGSCCGMGPGDKGISLGNVPSKKPRMVGDMLFIPDSYKIVELTKQLDALRQIAPGTLADVSMHISKMSGVYPLKVYNDGQEFHLSSGSAHFPPMGKMSALKLMIEKLGMSLTDAEDLVKDAMAGKPVRVNVLTKAAQGNPAMPTSLPGNRVSNYATARMPMESNAVAGGEMGMDPILGVPAERPYTAAQKASVPQDQPPEKPFYAKATYDRGGDMSAAIQAARSGQKDVFDVATIGSLAKQVDIGELIDKYQSDLMTGLDRVGRILFAFYWHYDKFADRYGQQDLPDLEDALKNTFTQLGDLVLFLKQKSIEPNVNVGLPLMAGISD